MRKFLLIIVAMIIVFPLIGVGLVMGQGTVIKALPTTDDKNPPPNTDVSSASFSPILKDSISGYKLLTEYNGYKLEYGLWYDECTRIYSIGKSFRVIEISNYPRVYRDTVSHVYTKDTTFTVTEADLNYYDEKGARFYQDSQGKLFKLGDKATHFAGEPLPGEFPSWLEYDKTQKIDKENSFSISNLISDTYFKSAVLLNEDGTMLPLTGKEVNSLINSLRVKSSVLTTSKGGGRQLLYILAVRKLYDGN